MGTSESIKRGALVRNHPPYRRYGRDRMQRQADQRAGAEDWVFEEGV